jgi:ABC-2 type transport system permease protein
MREALIVFRREFLERVRSKAFLWSTILSPILMIAMIAIPVIVAKATSVKRHFALVDEAPAPIGDQFADLFTARKEGDEGNQYTLERVHASFEEKHDELQTRTMEEEIDGYIVLPADVIEKNEILYRARNVGAESIVKDIRNAATQAVQTERLRLAGLVHADVAELMRRVEVDDASVTATGEGRGAAATFLFAYLLAFLIYIMTAIYGAGVLRSVLEEKTQRIAEVLVSSVKASHLMLGKILGVGSAALLQMRSGA